MNSLLPRIVSGALMLMLLATASCGSGFNPGQQSQGRQRGPTHNGEVSQSTLLAELDALAIPAGADASQFAALKDDLRQMIVAGPARMAAKAPTGQANRITDLILDVDLESDEETDPPDAFSWTYRNVGDYNLDSEVNISDLAALGASMGQDNSSPQWLTKGQYADGNGDGLVSISDLTPLGANLLSQVQEYKIEVADSPDGPWTEVATVDFSAALEGTGAPRYRYIASGPVQLLRVIATDNAGNPGEPSDPARSFLLSPKAELVGQPGGPQFVSLNGDTLELALPDSEPTTIEVGDTVAGDNGDGGFIGRVETVVQAGSSVTVTLSTATIADLIQRGTLDMSIPDSGAIRYTLNAKGTSKLPQVVGQFDSQNIRTDGAVSIDAFDTTVLMEPDFFTRLHLDGSGQVDYFKTYLIADELVAYAKLKLTANFNGTFPIDLNDRHNYEKQFFDKNYDFDLIVDGITIPARYNLRMYVGMEGEGQFNGSYQAALAQTNSDIKIGSTWKLRDVGSAEYPDGWRDYAEFDVLDGPTDALIAAGGGSVRFRSYVRFDFRAYVFGQQLGMMAFDPYCEVDATTVTTPEPGFDYKVDQALGAALMFDETVYNGVFTGRGYSQNRRTVVDSFTPGNGSAKIAGFLRESDSTPVAGAQVDIYADYPGAPAATAQSGADGSFEFDNLIADHTYKVIPTDPSYGFTPLDADVVAKPYAEPVLFNAGSAQAGISGTVFLDNDGDGDGDGPFEGVTLNLYDNTDNLNPVLLDTKVSAADGTYKFTGVATGLAVLIEAELPGYAFDPDGISFAYGGGNSTGHDFVGDDADFRISGTILDGSNGVEDVTVHFGPPSGGEFFWWPTDVTGFYQTGQSFTPGITVRVTPELDGYTFEGPSGLPYEDVFMDSDKVVDFTAFPITEWTHSVGFNSGQDETVRGIVGDSAGNTYVCGFAVESAPSTEKTALVARYSPSGALLWSREEAVSFVGEAQFNALDVNASGVYTVGTFDNENTFNQEILVMKWDPDGNVVWKESWGLGTTSSGWACALDTGGNLYVGGEGSNGVTGQDAVVLKYAADGSLLWQKVYAAVGTDFIRGGFYDSGNFFMTGHAPNTQPTPSEDISLLKIFNDGSVSDAQLYDLDDLYNTGLSIQVDGSFNVYIGGSTVVSGGLTSDGTVLKLDPTNDPVAGRNWKTAEPGATFHQFNAIKLDGFGNIFASGYWSDGTLNGALVKLDTATLGLTTFSTELFSGSGETRFYALSQDKLDGDLLLGGYAPDATGDWNVAGATGLDSPFSKSEYVGVLADALGTVNPSSAFTNDFFPTEDTGQGGNDALTIKRVKP